MCMKNSNSDSNFITPEMLTLLVEISIWTFQLANYSIFPIQILSTIAHGSYRFFFTYSYSRNVSRNGNICIWKLPKLSHLLALARVCVRVCDWEDRNNLVCLINPRRPNPGPPRTPLLPNEISPSSSSPPHLLLSLWLLPLVELLP